MSWRPQVETEEMLLCSQMRLFLANYWINLRAWMPSPNWKVLVDSTGEKNTPNSNVSLESAGVHLLLLELRDIITNEDSMTEHRRVQVAVQANSCHWWVQNYWFSSCNALLCFGRCFLVVLLLERFRFLSSCVFCGCGCVSSASLHFLKLGTLEPICFTCVILWESNHVRYISCMSCLCNNTAACVRTNVTFSHVRITMHITVHLIRFFASHHLSKFTLACYYHQSCAGNVGLSLAMLQCWFVPDRLRKDLMIIQLCDAMLEVAM